MLRSGTGFSWRWEKRGPRGALSPRLAVHTVETDTGSLVQQVAILDPQGISSERDLSQTPGEFDAPIWSADGSIIMAVSDSSAATGGDIGGSTLYMEDSSGAHSRMLAHVDGTVILDLSPDGRSLAWSANPSSGDTVSRTLYVLDLSAAQNTARALSGDDYVAAFFWSPDGRKIAYFVPSGDDDTIALKVLTVKSGAVRTAATFTPSPYFLSVLQEYGQYAESVRLWSPDSRFVLYCQQQPDSFDVMVAYADQPIAPRKVADGLMASWSPR